MEMTASDVKLTEKQAKGLNADIFNKENAFHAHPPFSYQLI